jgi:hypothetical protein
MQQSPTMELPRTFELPDEVKDWDDKTYFIFLQEHQFGYQAILDDLKSKGLEHSDEYRHFVEQFKRVEGCMARDFNRRYHQG